MWERDTVEVAPGTDAVPLRRVIGPSPTSGRWGKLAVSAIAGMGWVVAGAMVFGGGYLLWHLLFGDSVGGDVWLGQPPAWVEQQAAGSDDDLPGGVPWSPDMIDRTTTPGGGTVPLSVELDASSTTTVVTVPATAAPTVATTVAQAPVVQAPAGGASVTTVRPAAPVTTARPPSTTVATTTATTVANTVTATTVANTVTSTTVANTVTSTTISEPTTTDDTSTTVDTGDDSSGRGRGGSGGGGG